jgi:hypothetical protein
MLPPASAAIFTHSLFHAVSTPGPRRDGIRAHPAPAPAPADLDARILETPAPHEDPRFSATRRMAEVLALFARLTVAETRAMHARVRRTKSSDPVAIALSTLGTDRKAALVLFLGRHRVAR